MKRNFLKLLATSPVWSSPVINAVITPAHAQASPLLCDADGSLQWNVVSYTDTLGTQVVQGGFQFRTTIQGDAIEVELTASTNPPLIVDFPTVQGVTLRGGTLQTGTYDRLNGIATMETCSVLPGTNNLFCAVPPYTIDFQCGAETLTYIETDVNNNVTTIVLDSPTPI